MASNPDSRPVSNEGISTSVRWLHGVIELPVRPLSFQELAEVVSLARRTGWYGNLELLRLVARTGLTLPQDQVESILGDDVFVTANVAREVWIATLRQVSRQTAKLARVSSGAHVPKVRRYTSRDLATPGLLYFIREDLRNIDASAFTRFVVSSHIRDMQLHGRLLTPRQRWHQIKKLGYERTAVFVLESLGIDRGLFTEARLRCLREAERSYAIFIFSTTLDWCQYRRQIEAYNLALIGLVGNSLLLAGLAEEDVASHLQVGVPLFPSLVSHVEEVPLQVCVALLNDAYAKRLGKIPRRFHPLITAAFARARNAARAAADPAKDRQARILDAGTALLKSFAIAIAENPQFTQVACLAYHDEYCAHLTGILEAEARQYRAQMGLANVPDCYALVEGPSEVEYVERAIELLGGADLRIRVEDCGGKAGVVLRFRHILERHSYIGAIAALLDADAEKEYRDLERIASRSKLLAVHRIEKGTIEDCFPHALQARVLNRLYPGLRVRAGDLRSSAQRANVLKRVLWERGQVPLEKVALARATRPHLRVTEQVPEEIRSFAQRAIDLAQLRAAARRHANERFADPQGDRLLAQLLDE